MDSFLHGVHVSSYDHESGFDKAQTSRYVFKMQELNLFFITHKESKIV